MSEPLTPEWNRQELLIPPDMQPEFTPIELSPDGLDDAWAVIMHIHSAHAAKKRAQLNGYLYPLADLFIRIKRDLFPTSTSEGPTDGEPQAGPPPQARPGSG